MGTTTIQKRNVEWFDEEYREKIAKKNEARRRILQKETWGSYQKYKELQKEVKKACKKKKQEHLQKQLKGNRAAEQTGWKKKNFIKQWIISGKVLFDKEEIMNRWAEHFREALNKEYPSCNDQGKLDLALNNEESDKGENSEMPTYEEIEESIKKLKNGRAPGEDNIIPEMIKYEGETTGKKITRTNMCHGGKKRCLKTGKLVLSAPYLKKGDKLDCNNYRGIILLDIVYKVFSNILNERLKKITENVLGEYQCGFRKNRST
jgi:hypothetical protein